MLYMYKKDLTLMIKKYQRLIDHCHRTGKYRGTAHDICNLRYKIPKDIPVVFHNSSTYDYKFIIKELPKNLKVSLNVWQKIQKTT